MKLLNLAAFAALTAIAHPAFSGTQLIPSAHVDLAAGTATFPLREGKLADGTRFWFILTESSDRAVSERLGLGYSPRLAKAATVASTRHVTIGRNGFVFDKGTVDFSPVRNIVPGDGPNYFPPKTAEPGSVASADYSTLAVDANGVVFNAPIITKGGSLRRLRLHNGNPDYSKVHDKVVSIDAIKCEVTLKLTEGFTDDHKVVYLSFDSNVGLAAAMEAATLAPAESDLLGSDAELDLFAIVNGATGKDNPERQGFNSALAGEGSPLNLLTLPAQGRLYSPLWDVNVAVFSEQAIRNNQVRRFTNADDVETAASAGLLTNPKGEPVGSVGILVNCPVVQVLE